MTQQEAIGLVRGLLTAGSGDELMQLVSKKLPELDSTFFTVAEAAAGQLDREGKGAIAVALRKLSDQMLSMKTLI